MDTIILRDNKAFLNTHITGDQYSEKEIDSLSLFLQCDIEECDNFTFGDFWKFISKDVDFYQKVFNQTIGGFDLRLYVNEALSLTEDHEDNLSFIEVSHYLNIDDWMNYKPEWKIESDYSTSIFGISKTDDNTYSIGLTSLSKISHIDIKINKSLMVYKSIYKEKIKNTEREEMELGEMNFTVYDLINTILYEVSFYGTPEGRDKFEKDLLDSVEKIRTGKMKTFPLDENIFNL